MTNRHLDSTLLNMDGIGIAIFIITVTLRRTLSEDIPEFQYPCFVDVCTFPSQYCNSDRYERRCSPCSRAVCRQTNVPLACRYICMKHNELKTTLKPTTVTTSQPRSESAKQGNVDSLHLIMSYSAVTTTLLVVVLLSFIAYYIHRKKAAKEKRASTRTCHREDLFQEISSENQRDCHYCRHNPRPETLNIQIAESSMCPPSYRTYDQGRPINARSNTPSDPGSTDSVPSSTAKTVVVNPLPPKVNNSTAANKINNNKSMDMCDSGTQAFEMESLIDSRETDNFDETGRKVSNT